MVLGLTKCPLFLATLDPGPGNRSLLGLGLRKFPKPRDNQTSVGLHNHALVTPQGLEPVIAGVRGRTPKPLEDGAILPKGFIPYINIISYFFEKVKFFGNQLYQTLGQNFLHFYES